MKIESQKELRSNDRLHSLGYTLDKPAKIEVRFK